ncbi:uncharacterized protein BKA55DRAFT_572021, partial [Fusarium redolens]
MFGRKVRFTAGKLPRVNMLSKLVLPQALSPIITSFLNCEWRLYAPYALSFLGY